MATETVYLDIETTNPGGYATATTTPTSSTTYYYQFTGGTDQKGNVDVTTEKDNTEINISLHANSNGPYDLIDATPKTDNSNGDITVTSNTPNKITITDKAEVNNVEMTYTVNAKPKGTTDLKIHCDPRVKNNW
ncbi:MAG: hypothetical protein V7746_00390 [Halioglobus sp.]